MTLTHEQFCREVLGQEPYFVNPNIKYYKKTNTNGKLVVAYQRAEDGTWFDTTIVEKAKIELITAREEFEKRQNEAMLEEYRRRGRMSIDDIIKEEQNVQS